MANLLNLVLEVDWFDKIKSGEKTSEYRMIREHWNSMFKDVSEQQQPYSLVRFQRAFSKNAETMIFEIIKIEKTSEKNDLNVECCWAIRLGRMLTEKDLKNVGLNYREGEKRNPFVCNCRSCDFSTKSLTCNSKKVKATYFCDGFLNRFWGIKNNRRVEC